MDLHRITLNVYAISVSVGVVYNIMFGYKFLFHLEFFHMLVRAPFATNIWQPTINESTVSLERNFSDHNAGPTFAITSSLKAF